MLNSIVLSSNYKFHLTSLRRENDVNDFDALFEIIHVMKRVEFKYSFSLLWWLSHIRKLSFHFRFALPFYAQMIFALIITLDPSKDDMQTNNASKTLWFKLFIHRITNLQYDQWKLQWKTISFFQNLIFFLLLLLFCFLNFLRKFYIAQKMVWLW